MTMMPTTLLALISFSVGMSTMAEPNYDPETSVCGAMQEPLAFWLWSNTAGEPNVDAYTAYPNAEALQFETRDGRLLKGYKLAATAGGEPQGRLLVAQGNAMLADQLLDYLNELAAAGFETYVYDYRGYGNSEGRPRLKAIVGDYVELAAHLQPTHLYGISFGGVVMLNVIGDGFDFQRAVIDSSPAKISSFGCPESYDPARNFPEDASGLLVISGERDRVVPTDDVRELLELARERGGKVVVGGNFDHPFMDAPSTHQVRLELIRAFLAGRDLN